MSIPPPARNTDQAGRQEIQLRSAEDPKNSSTTIIHMFKLYKFVLGIILSLFIAQTAAAQSVKISGVVIEKTNGQPLPGVSVVIRGTSAGTQTNQDGKFS
ncbi:MAG TPA: carboxypeptidase-like regulatory domain-containing protein, partial [Pedobacter sp.]